MEAKAESAVAMNQEMNTDTHYSMGKPKKRIG